MIRVMVGVRVRAGEYGHFYTHFDDPQTVMQTQTVDERVINYWPCWLLGSLPYRSLVVGGGRKWSVMTLVKPVL